MDDARVTQFHSNPATLAGELAFRRAMRSAGLSEQEIDAAILQAYVRSRVLRAWLPTALVASVLLGVYLKSVVALLAFALTSGFAAWGWAAYISLAQSKSLSCWTRRPGTTWTGEWERLRERPR
jgi:hypothetical protein